MEFFKEVDKLVQRNPDYFTEDRFQKVAIAKESEKIKYIVRKELSKSFNPIPDEHKMNFLVQSIYKQFMSVPKSLQDKIICTEKRIVHTGYLKEFGQFITNALTAYVKSTIRKENNMKLSVKECIQYKKIVHSEISRIKEECVSQESSYVGGITQTELVEGIIKFLAEKRMLYILDISENKKETYTVHPRYRITFHNIATQVDSLLVEELKKTAFGIGMYLQPFMSYFEYGGALKSNIPKKEVKNLNLLTLNLFMRQLVFCLQGDTTNKKCSEFLKTQCKLTDKEVNSLLSCNKESFFEHVKNEPIMCCPLFDLIASDNVYLPYVSLVMNNKDTSNYVTSEIFVQQLLFYFETYSLTLHPSIGEKMKDVCNNLINE